MTIRDTLKGMKVIILSVIKRWLPLAFLATALCALVYLTVQQSFRQSANDPQIQMAEDAATALQTSISMQNVIPKATVNINESLSPYLVFYNASGTPTAGNGMLDGALPNLPAGVFNRTAEAGEERLTWQPRPDVRQAIVVIAMPTGFVMAGRSLREVEFREDQLSFETGATWLLTVISLLALEILIAAIESHWIRK